MRRRPSATGSARRPLAGLALAIPLTCSIFAISGVVAPSVSTAVSHGTQHFTHANPPAHGGQEECCGPPPAAGGEGQAPAAVPLPAAAPERPAVAPSAPAAALRHERKRVPHGASRTAASPHGGAGTQDERSPEGAGGTPPAAQRTHERVTHNRPREQRHDYKTPVIAPPPAFTPPAQASAAPPAAAVTVAPAAVSAAVTPAASPPAVHLGSAQKATGPVRRAPARRRRSARASAGGRPAAALTAALRLARPTGKAAARPEVPAASAGQPRRLHAAESPLVTTVTKIINVVPPFMRVLIGGLIALTLALAASSQLAAVKARRLARQRSELLEDVGLLQGALLPPLPARLGPVGTSAAYRPASGPGAGGDFYDVFALGDGQLAVIVGDVSGHGRQALPHTTLVRFTLRAYLEAGMSPRGALQAAAPVLERQLGDSFATVVLATYHPRERVLVYACAGHPPPVVLANEDGVQEPIVPITACSAPPIGVGRTTGTRQTAVSIPGAALACFYTDGVVEARVRGELYGHGRLERVLDELPADATADTVLERVAAESDRHPDDMAACLLRVEGNAGAPLVRVEELELDAPEAERDRAERFLVAAGIPPAEVQETLSAARSAVSRHGRVVIQLRLGAGDPEVTLHPQNVAVLSPALRDTANAGGMQL
jgi:serine phosphatase RsbU (regulator of sigma subunit)